MIYDVDRRIHMYFSPCCMCFYAIYFHLWVRREGGNLIFITDALDLFFQFSCWRFFPFLFSFVMSDVLFVSLSARCILFHLSCIVDLVFSLPTPPLLLLLLLLLRLTGCCCSVSPISCMHIVRFHAISYSVVFICFIYWSENWVFLKFWRILTAMAARNSSALIKSNQIEVFKSNF